VFGARFLGVKTVAFSAGSVLVNSVVRLLGAVSDDDQQALNASVVSVFASNGFVIDSFSLESDTPRITRYTLSHI